MRRSAEAACCTADCNAKRHISMMSPRHEWLLVQTTLCAAWQHCGRISQQLHVSRHLEQTLQGLTSTFGSCG